jgi:hypothetical protein
MPLEIRELVIKANVVNPGAGAAGQASAADGTGANSTSPQEQLINICVEKVLEIIKEKIER